MVDARGSMGGTESYSPSIEYKQRLDDDCNNSGCYSISGLFWIYRQEVSESDRFWKVEIDSVIDEQKRGICMRKCLRCECDMIENLSVVSDMNNTLVVKEKGLLKSSLGNIMCAVCPQCGYVETYIDSHRKLENI